MNTNDMILELEAMQKQIIHGNTFFSEAKRLELMRLLDELYATVDLNVSNSNILSPLASPLAGVGKTFDQCRGGIPAGSCYPPMGLNNPKAKR